MFGSQTKAPLLANINAFVWEPNMIYFNSLTHVRTPNYYVQQLFAQNACGKLVDLTSDTTDMKGKANLYASALINENEIIVKLVNANETAVDFEFSFPKGIKVAPRGEIQTLHHPVPLASNTLDNPDRVIPSTQPLLLENPDAAKVTLQGHSVNILKFKLAE